MADARTERDLADLFAEVYDVLDGESADLDPLTCAAWMKHHKVVVEEIAAEACTNARLSYAQVQKYLKSVESRFVLLCAIDAAFATIDPLRGNGNDGRMSRYSRRLDRLHKYNTDRVGGHLLPRLTRPGRAAPVEDQWSGCLHSLLRVKDMPWQVVYGRCEPEWDARWTIDVRSDGTPTVKVAVVPFIGSLDELAIRPINKERPWYEIVARDASFWKSRIADVLARLDECGACIAILPELALSDPILELWQAALSRTRRPQGGRLHWLLVGSGPVRSLGGNADHDQPPNRAVILERDSGFPVEFSTFQRSGRKQQRVERIFVQDKCKGFHMRPSLIRNWGLDERLGDDQARAEWMRRGQHRMIIETGVGRMTVMICEDHGRLLSEGAKAALLEPSLIFVPIFAQPIRRYFWEETSAQKIVSEVGSSVVVVNSCAVPDPDSGEFETCSALLLYSAEDDDGVLTARTESQNAAAADDIRTFDVPLVPVNDVNDWEISLRDRLSASP